MTLEGKRIGFVMTGSFCTFKKTIPQIKKILEEGGEVLPIMTDHSYEMDTKFGKAADFKKEIEDITGKKIIHTIQEAEPIGQKGLTDVMVVAPCSGNTLGKLAQAIVDNAALMAIKSHLRNENPLIIGISTNDGLGASAQNIGILLNRKHIYFIPFRQDNPITKPRSLVFDPEYIIPTIEIALDREQIQPVLL